MTETSKTTTGHSAEASEPLLLTEFIVAPPEAVFDFLVDPTKLRRWMGDIVADPQPGGDFRLDMGDHAATGEYLVVERPTTVSFTWGWDHVDEVPPGSTIVTLTLSVQGDGTLVELRHDGLPLGPEDEHKTGWTSCLERLASELGAPEPGYASDL